MGKNVAVNLIATETPLHKVSPTKFEGLVMQIVCIMSCYEALTAQ